MLISIAITLGGLFFYLPWCLRSFQSPVLIPFFILYFVPLLPTLSAVLQGWPGARWRTLPWIYQSEFLSLVFELGFILFVLPVVALNLVTMLLGLLVGAIGIGLVVALGCCFARFGAGASACPDDNAQLALILVGLLPVEVGLVALNRYVEKRDKSRLVFFRRVYCRVRQNIGLDERIDRDCGPA